MITNAKEALMFLVQKHQGNWDEVQSQVDPNLIEWFINLRYVCHVKDSWQITSEGIRKSLFYRDPTPEERALGNLLIS